MNSANISELRDRLSDYLRRVRRGETIIVLDRDTPVARLEPVGRSMRICWPATSRP
jgi:prevent-host-death family protein